MEKELALKDFINQRTAGESFKHEILGRPESKGHDLRITLITPNVIISKGQLKRVQPPLGIACIAAVLDEYNFKELLLKLKNGILTIKGSQIKRQCSEPIREKNNA